MGEERGVVYLAFGYEYCIKAVNSACSLKSFHPNLDISIVTNIQISENIGTTVEFNGKKIGPELFDQVIHIDEETQNNRNYKTSIGDYTPYEKTLFLDCDTVIQDSIVEGFNFLNYSDMACFARPLPARAMIERWEGDIHVENVDIEDVSTFYSGVFFFNKSKTKEFFRLWNSKYKEFGYRYDQFSFTNSIIESDVDFIPFPMIWNAMDKDIERYEDYDPGYNLDENIKIRHKNYMNYRRMRKYRKLEEKIGDKFLKYDEQEKQEIRTVFKKKHSRKKALKRHLRKYDFIRLPYQKLKKTKIYL